MYDQEVFVTGRVGQTPESQYTTSGKMYTKFSVAYTETWTDNAGQKQEATTWFRCVTWDDKLAKNIAEWVVSGQIVSVRGKVKASPYTDRDGKAAASLELNIYKCVFGPKPQGNGDGSGSTSRKSTARTPAEEELADVPF